MVRKIVIIMLSVMVILVSCTKIDVDYDYDTTIKLQVNTEGSTKGTVTTTDVLKASGAFSMMAYLSDKYVKRLDPSYPKSPFDRGDGTAVGTGEEPFKFGDDDGKYFDDDAENGNVTLSKDGWGISGNPKWVSGVDTYFWAWHPVTIPDDRRVISDPEDDETTVFPEDPKDPDSPRSPKTGKLSFSYTTPTPDGATDADRAEDLLFAYSKKRFVEKKDLTDSDKTINITFHHALSQVRFCVSTDDGTFDESLKIKSISISNLATSGNAYFTDSGNAENNQYAYDTSHGSYDKFVWTGQAGTATFGQTYNADFSTSTVSGWTKGSYTKDTHTYNLYTCENVFFMIPQTVTSSNKITVVFDYEGEDITKTIDIADSTGNIWLGDYYYTYKIKATTLGRDIDFSVSLVGWSNRKEEIFI